MNLMRRNVHLLMTSITGLGVVSGARQTFAQLGNSGSADSGANMHPLDNCQGTKLIERTKYRRAVEAALWGMPIVAADAIRQGFLRDIGAKYNDIAYFSKPADWKFQTTTPNASTYYIYSAYSTKQDGPMVLEVPAAVGAGIYGQVCDMWDVPLEIVGPGGEDKGKGGKYLILPPGFGTNVPTGYFPVRMQTYGGFWLMRTIPNSTSESDVANAIALLKKIRIYPLSKADNPPEQRFVDAAGKLWDGYPRMDGSLYAVLAKMVNEEPVIPRDLAMMDILRSVGIEKGKAFKADAATTATLDAAAKEAHATINDMQRALVSPYWDGTHWTLPDTTSLKTEFSFQDATMLDYDSRAVANFFAWAPPKNADPNAPTIYILAYDDSAGTPLAGGKTYRLRVPSSVPAKQYWSITAYDYETACFIREAAVISVDSYNQKTKKNGDGSVDIWFAPQAPAGQKENWVTTAQGGQWFVIFRLYGPDKPFFDKSWKLPDIEKVA
jgi:hypothetical protein